MVAKHHKRGLEHYRCSNLFMGRNYVNHNGMGRDEEEVTNLTIIYNGQAVTSSLQVAKDFEKQHKDVLESIDELIKGVAENSAYSKSPMFYEDSYIHPQNKQKYRMYYMNRDGFTLLAMGFTGTKALEFKLKYIEAFNKMEQELLQQERNKQFTMPNSPLEIMQMAINQMVEQDKRLKEHEEKLQSVEEKQNNITEILSLNNNDWRNKVNKIINAIVQKLGGGQYYQEIRQESYDLLEKRANCLLNKRLENRKSKMALRGQSKTAIGKLSKLDIIEEDKKLVSVYITVIKELAVKYQLNLTEYQLMDELE